MFIRQSSINHYFNLELYFCEKVDNFDKMYFLKLIRSQPDSLQVLSNLY